MSGRTNRQTADSMKPKTRKDRRVRRHRRVRRAVHGTAERPRMCIAKSNRQLYVQFVDDVRGATLASAGTLGVEGRNNVEAARVLGRRAAAAALDKGIRRVVVDRGGYRFHGRVKMVVDAAVEAGVSISAREGRGET